MTIDSALFYDKSECFYCSFHSLWLSNIIFSFFVCQGNLLAGRKRLWTNERENAEQEKQDWNEPSVLSHCTAKIDKTIWNRICFLKFDIILTYYLICCLLNPVRPFEKVNQRMSETAEEEALSSAA